MRYFHLAVKTSASAEGRYESVPGCVKATALLADVVLSERKVVISFLGSFSGEGWLAVCFLDEDLHVSVSYLFNAWSNN